mmetsp:Transcript_10459/g.18234  ORF Transcript_10459/g.18234 Transcript_10459/m.18234 type:complete len:272 (+) Transcript_10459:1046-1861(+)
MLSQVMLRRLRVRVLPVPVGPVQLVRCHLTMLRILHFLRLACRPRSTSATVASTKDGEITPVRATLKVQVKHQDKALQTAAGADVTTMPTITSAATTSSRTTATNTVAADMALGLTFSARRIAPADRPLTTPAPMVACAPSVVEATPVCTADNSSSNSFRASRTIMNPCGSVSRCRHLCSSKEPSNHTVQILLVTAGVLVKACRRHPCFTTLVTPPMPPLRQVSPCRPQVTALNASVVLAAATHPAKARRTELLPRAPLGLLLVLPRLRQR